MKTQNILAFFLFTLLTAAGAIFFHGCTSTNDSEPTGTAQSGNKKPLPLVRIAPVVKTGISKLLELTGSVEPYRVAGLASPAEGPVAEIRVREADSVTKGQALVSIGRKKGVNALVSSLEEELKTERDNLDRTRQLVETGAIPGEQLDFAKTSYEKVSASLIRAKESESDYILKAPWDGVISHINVREGEFVAPRTVLMEMYDPSSLLIRASIPEKPAFEVYSGIKAEVRLDAYPGNALQGRVERVYPYLDPRLRTRTIEITLIKPVDLLPGMFARLKLFIETAENAIVIPSEALVSTPNGPGVFVFEKNKAVLRLVKTGIETDNLVEIISGISTGDRVITAGNARLKNGADVRIEQAEKPNKKEDTDGSQLSAGSFGTNGDNP